MLDSRCGIHHIPAVTVFVDSDRAEPPNERRIDREELMKKETLVSWHDLDGPDLNGNGIPDELEPPHVDVYASAAGLQVRLRQNTSCDPRLCAGDYDARWDMAESAGDETVGASGSTPDQSVVDDIGEALGITYRDGEELGLVDKERSRDTHRWELDPASSDDFIDRMRALAPVRKARRRFQH